jgi:hypothetical protein
MHSMHIVWGCTSRTRDGINLVLLVRPLMLLMQQLLLLPLPLCFGRL